MDQILPLSAVCEVICARQKRFGTVPRVTTDSRAITPGCMFVALRGESFDGHNYIADALAKGAAYAVADTRGPWPEEQMLYVGDTERALRRIASLYRDRLGVRLVAITGSVGKTSTRGMAAAVLESRFSTHSTRANLNNQVGVPQTLLEIGAGCEAAVIEMGMSGPGEIEELTLCARPDAAVITNIGVSHIERLGSREAIFCAKTEIVEGLRPGAPLIINGDDDLLAGYRNDNLRLIRFGIDHPACEARALDLTAQGEWTGFTIRWEGADYPARIPAMGRHSVQNALAGFCAGVVLGIPPGDAAAALERYAPTGMRQRVVERGAYTVVEDCYNASPDSFAAALRTLAERPCAGRRVLIAADMLELGPVAEESHYEVGRLAGKLGLDAVWTYGDLAERIRRGAEEAGVTDAAHFADKQALAEHITSRMRPGDLLWLKASRGMKLEEVLESIYRVADRTARA